MQYMRDICARRRIGRRGGSLVLAAAVACVLAAGPWPVLAGEADAPPPETSAEREAEESVEREEAPPEAPPPDPEEASPDIFVPSEDISEDLSVRFPVDI